MKTLLMRVDFGRKNTKEKSYNLFTDYNNAIDFVRIWTSNPENWSSSPVWVKTDTETFNNVWNIK